MIIAGERADAAWIDDPAARLERKNSFDASLTIGAARFNRDTGRLTSNSRPFLWAIDKETGLIRSDLARPRRCPVCDESPGPELFVKDGFRHVRCRNCGLIYVSLVLREDVMEKYWREEMTWMSILNSEPQIELDRRKFQYGLELAAARVKGRSVLDVGSGNGVFVRVAAEAGWESAALELNRESGEKMEAEGFRVIVKRLETAGLPSGSFDLITFWEVLEHLPDPRMTLAEARRLLVDDGIFLIMTPNVDSMVTRLLHDRSNTFGGHSHLNHFSPSTMNALLEKAGLKALEMETVITELGAINNYLSFEDPYDGEAEAFMPELTPALIHERLWGSRLLTLAARGDL
ncbi:MAG: class I SAM-dependent methyltransferase [Candidatus Adiutrix sp.]|jgi:SAM-dependent methyltransferase|nr:class I SAM-dependent methyltransferase [Candidatus Adiutrix sp.]